MGIGVRVPERVMKALLHTQAGKQGRGVVTALLVLSVVCAPAVAREDTGQTPLAEPGPATYPGFRAPETYTPWPLARTDSLAVLPFDLGGSDERKLRLQLDQPLDLRAIGVHDVGIVNRAERGAGRVVSGTGLSYQLDDRLSLGSGVTLGEAMPGFQSLGSIHCEDGTLNAASYTASNCYFIDNPATFRTGTAALGAQLKISEQAAASVRLFRSESDLDLTGHPGQSAPPMVDPATLGLAGGHPLLAGVNSLLGVQQLESELTGVDLEFQVGISTDRAGDMVLGLQLTRVLDSEMDGTYYTAPGIHNWTLAEPFDTAGVSFDWSRGAFSGGIQSYYRAPVEFMNRDPLADHATFDVHFTWRAPWNASVSVGASNLLDAGADEGTANENSLTVDPFESIYGRIPYVRYKQDL